MARCVPESRGPVLHKIWYGFFDEKEIKEAPFESEISSLVLQTELYLQAALGGKLGKNISSVKAVHVSWEYNNNEESSSPPSPPAPSNMRAPFQLSFVLHVRESNGEWLRQNDILKAVGKLNFQPYITDYVWKTEKKNAEDNTAQPSVFKHAVNNVYLESAENLPIPVGFWPQGVGIPEDGSSNGIASQLANISQEPEKAEPKKELELSKAAETAETEKPEKALEEEEVVVPEIESEKENEPEKGNEPEKESDEPEPENNEPEKEKEDSRKSVVLKPKKPKRRWFSIFRKKKKDKKPGEQQQSDKGSESMSDTSAPQQSESELELENETSATTEQPVNPEPEPEVERDNAEPPMNDGPKKKFDEVYELDKLLGKGSFAVVVAGRHKETQDPYAIKIITKSEMQEFDYRCLGSEIGVLKALPRHEHIIRLYDVFDEEYYVCLIMEKVNGGELVDRLVKKSVYTEREARDVMKIVMDAVHHCHRHQVAHRDLKPANLLLTSPTDDTAIKIADFGFAKYCPGPDSLITQCGSTQHIAPEILNNDRYGTKVDMWALGVITFELISGEPPFNDKTEDDVFRNIVNCDYSFDKKYWNNVSQDSKDMVRNLLCLDPPKRWSTEQCLASKWMEDDGEELCKSSLHKNQARLEAYNAKRKLKAAVYAVIGLNRLQIM